MKFSPLRILKANPRVFNFSYNLYGVIISLSIFFALIFTEHRLKKKGYSADLVWKLSLWILPFGLIGARLYHVFDLWSYYSQDLTQVFAVWNGGLGIIGGLVGGGIGLVLAVALGGPDFAGARALQILDAAAPAIAFAQGLGRWANVFNKELLPYAYYESVANFGLFLLLIAVESKFLKQRKKYPSGLLFLFYLGGYTLIRIFLESFHYASWQLGSVNVPYVALPLVTIMYGVVLCLSNVREGK